MDVIINKQRVQSAPQLLHLNFWQIKYVIVSISFAKLVLLEFSSLGIPNVIEIRGPQEVLQLWRMNSARDSNM